jgi:hypothetical protein
MRPEYDAALRLTTANRDCWNKTGTSRRSFPDLRFRRVAFLPELLGGGALPHDQSDHLVTLDNLAWQQERLHQLTFTTNSHTGELLEPFPDGYFRIRCQPVGKMNQVFERNLPFNGTIAKMLQQMGWQALAANLRHGFPRKIRS